MAERTKASDAMSTVAASNLGHGRHFSPGRHVSGDRGHHLPNGHGRYLGVLK